MPQEEKKLIEKNTYLWPSMVIKVNNTRKN